VPATKPTDTAQPNPKLVPKLTEYATELATLKALADEFNDFYTGDRGIWTSQYDSLREIWNAKADNTKHMDTKLTCERLQRSMKDSMRKLESATKLIARIADNPSDPEVVRTKANMEVIEGFRAALERNKTSNYEQFYPLLMRLR
jgi:hypothetical protein